MRAHSRAHTPHGKSKPQKAKRGVHRDPRRPRLRNARRTCGDQVGIELVEAPRRVEIKPRPEKQQRGIDHTPHRRGQLRAAHALRLQRPRREVGEHLHRSAVVLPAEERTMPKASQAGHTQLFHTREIGPSPLRIRVVPHHLHIIAVARAVAALKAEKEEANMRELPPVPALPREPALKPRIVKQQVPDPYNAKLLFSHSSLLSVTSSSLSAPRRWRSAPAIGQAPRARRRVPRG